MTHRASRTPPPWRHAADAAGCARGVMRGGLGGAQCVRNERRRLRRAALGGAAGRRASRGRSVWDLRSLRNSLTALRLVCSLCGVQAASSDNQRHTPASLVDSSHSAPARCTRSPFPHASFGTKVQAENSSTDDKIRGNVHHGSPLLSGGKRRIKLWFKANNELYTI